MTAPADRPAFDAGQARAAAERWRSRTPAREANAAAVRERRFDAVESRERLAGRVNRLLARLPVADAPAAGPRGAAALAALAGRRVTEAEVDNPLVERVIGLTRDFLSVAFLDQGRDAARAVARIVTRLGAGQVGYATGFLVSPALLLTNHHVLPAAAEAAASIAEFDYALDGRRQGLTVQRYPLRPDLFYLTSRELDFSLVAVAPRSQLQRTLASYAPLPLIADEGKIITGELVNIVQHPKGEMKQVVMREGRLCDMPPRGGDPATDPFTYYEADTEPGSSGSPVFNDQWEVIALHHSGVPRTNAQGDFLAKDGSVWRSGDDPARLDWVANEGVRVSRLMAFLGTALAALPPAEPGRNLLADLLSPDAPGPPATDDPATPQGTTVMTADPSPAPPSPAAIDLATAGGEVTFTLPLRITIALGAPVFASPRPSAGRPAAGPADVSSLAGPPVITENFKPDPDYASRPGFDRAFLGFDLPLPSLDNSVAGQAARLDDGGIELKYHHYSVVMNAVRRIAFVSAVNVDVDARAQLSRQGSDRWSFDPRIPDTAQTGPELYRNNPLDRGHLTRRADGAWGDTQSEAQSGNDDTFHWTNCSPQHEVFNQGQKASSAGLLLWGNLEDHVTDQARLARRRICVFNGPVFRSDDATYRSLLLPRQFWKIIVMQGDDGTPNPVGFLLSQAALIADLPQEDSDAGAFAPFQVKIAEIERLARLDFADLRHHDPLGLDGAERFFAQGVVERDVQVVRLRGPADIVLHGKV